MKVATPNHMKKTDALWVLALPIYQFIGTARHEFSHALAAMLQGADITEIRLLPSIHPTTGLLWGYVRWTGGSPDWITGSAPYLCDLIFIAIFYLLCTQVHRMPRWLWLNCFIIGIVSPLINLVYNYQKVFTKGFGDVNALVLRFPPNLVHPVFLGAIALSSACAWITIRAYVGRQGSSGLPPSNH